MDSAFTIPVLGYRVGLDALIGLIPGIGDLLTLAPSGYLVIQAALLGVPRRTLGLMIYNLALEALIGAIPIAGDVFDATWKANLRNLYLLERHLDPLGAGPKPSSRGLFLFVACSILLLAGVAALLVYALAQISRLLS